MFRNSLIVLALALACTAPAVPARAASAAADNPAEDPLLITAGFLNHHPDMRYRILGMRAYEKGEHARAFGYFRRAAFYADKAAQGMVAEMYWKGEGVERDPVMGYVWMDLAAERGYRGFLGLRERYWSELDMGQRARAVEAGQEVYARFGDAAAKPRYEFVLRTGRKQMTGSRTGFNRGVQIELPGPSGSQSIEGSKFYDPRYWDAKKYWAWQDGIWMKPRIGSVTVGEIEEIARGAVDTSSRIPETAPQADAPVPQVEDEDAMPLP